MIATLKACFWWYIRLLKIPYPEHWDECDKTCFWMDVVCYTALFIGILVFGTIILVITYLGFKNIGVI